MIKRFVQVTFGDDSKAAGGLIESKAGPWVKFEDIGAVVQEAYQNGKKVGQHHGYQEGYEKGKEDFIGYGGS